MADSRTLPAPLAAQVLDDLAEGRIDLAEAEEELRHWADVAEEVQRRG